MRANHFFNRDELHTKKEIKVPVKKHGALYADPEAFRTEEAIEGSASSVKTASPPLWGLAGRPCYSVLGRTHAPRGGCGEAHMPKETCLNTAAFVCACACVCVCRMCWVPCRPVPPRRRRRRHTL